MDTAWESRLAKFLTQLSAVQKESLDVLTRKTQLLAAADLAGLADVNQQEGQLIERLQECLQERATLLQQAADEGHPATDLLSVAASLPKSAQNRLANQVQQTSHQARLLQHRSLINWVVVQRTLIHLSQMLEIIATGGHMKPTYGKGDLSQSTGSLVNQVV
jgi:flagellar biosynthesis/type III secretory pathway chaperone